MTKQDRIEELERENSIMKSSINNIRRYLNSSKFSSDISVNKNDIFLRLDEMQQELIRTV